MVRHLLDRSTRVWLFYLKHRQGKNGKLSPNVTREVCGYLADSMLIAQVTPTFLRFFTSAWGPHVHLQTPIQVDINSRWVVLDDGRLFCSGCNFLEICLRVAYLLSCDGTVEELPNMLTARCRHGRISMEG